MSFLLLYDPTFAYYTLIKRDGIAVFSRFQDTARSTKGPWLRSRRAFSGRRKRDYTMPEYVQEQTKLTNGNLQQESNPDSQLKYNLTAHGF
jgi:hypothetical protein